MAALLTFVAGLALRPMAETDLFFHLATGQEILRRHALLGRNLFSFTYPDAPNIDTSWLFEVGAAALYARGGFPAIVLAKTVVLLAAFAGAYRSCRRRGAGAVASALALAAAAFVGRDRFVERPHVFSLAGEVAALAAIGALGERGGVAAARASAWFLGAVVVWANLHAGVFVAPLLVGAAAVAAGVAREEAAARRLALCAGGSALATLATPVGVGLVRYLRLHLTLPALHPIDEFRAPSWLSDAPLVLYAAVLLGGVAFLFAAGDSKARQRALRVLAPALPLAALTLHSVRFGADLALIAAPVMALAVTAAGDWLAAGGPEPIRRFLRSRLPAVALAASLIGFAAVPRIAAGSARAALEIGLDTRELPLEAIAFVDDNGLRDRMYNDFEIGSYLLFEPGQGYPRHRVFVDPRLPAYPAEMHRLLGRPDLTRDEWQAAMDRYGVESALLAYAGINRRVAWWDPARWALVFRGGDARVFVRRLPRFSALIAAHEIPATFAFSVEEGAATLPLDGRPAASPVADCEWSRRLGDLLVELDGALSERARAAYGRALAAPLGCLARADEARLGAWLGAVDLGAGRAESALALFERALGAGNRELSTFADRAAAFEVLGRRADAAAAWIDVAVRAGESPLAVRARARAGRLQ
ncbi:MAG TPA: hypothetical protein VI456_12155 [Polyangia bacterium]